MVSIEHATFAEANVPIRYQTLNIHHSSVTARVRWAVDTAKKYLVDHFDETVSLSTLAELTGVSRFHLCREFKQVVGMSPRAFQTLLRVWKAKRLLRHHAALAHVALDLGFADQAHFTRTFKRFVGTTPGQYQRSQLAFRSLS